MRGRRVFGWIALFAVCLRAPGLGGSAAGQEHAAGLELARHRERFAAALDQYAAEDRAGMTDARAVQLLDELLAAEDGAAALGQPPAPAEPAARAGEAGGAGFWDRFKDPLDGKFDVTAKSEGGSGFLPVPIPFNEPALGVGLVAGLLYFHPTDELPPTADADSTAAPPTTSFGLVGVSDNDSWLAVGGHAATLKQGRIRYLGLVGTASLNLDFYGIGGSVELDDAVGFNLAGNLLVQQAQFRLGKSRLAGGARYLLFDSDVDFESAVDDEVAGLGATSDAGLTTFVNYDTRDNLFTPNDGAYLQASYSSFAEWLGGDFDYWRVDLESQNFWQLEGGRWTIGMRTELNYASEEAPFYSLPWISLRGVPIMRYLGNYAVTVEIEPRWRIDSRWSVVSFAGIGRASDALDTLEEAEAAYNYGFGFRYLLTRKHGLGAGIDLAFGPEESVLTFTFGNAWAM